MKWSNIEIDHLKLVSFFDVSKDEELRKTFNWKNTQLLSENVHQHKGIKLSFLHYRLQFNSIRLSNSSN